MLEPFCQVLRLCVFWPRVKSGHNEEKADAGIEQEHKETGKFARAFQIGFGGVNLACIDLKTFSESHFNPFASGNNSLPA
ncbi:hypothetical protein RUM44_013248 [Polyplax serrata]|uniref:Uncharacterized protein n=1 Tax=Polyplax serrata TaxID=468196 RepID=A0ABR1BDL6_POLSC